MALFSYRTDELKPEVIAELFVETAADRHVIEQIKGESPVIIEGSRGTGKSFLLRMAELELLDSFERDRVVPVYLSFKESSLVQAKEENRFLYWMMAKICAQTNRALRALGITEPDAASLTLLGRGKTAKQSTLDDIIESFENSWRNPDSNVNVSAVPDVDDYIQAVSEICDRNNIARLCLLFDEAAHVFRMEQQHAFFSLFRDLRSPYVTCNAAVYPGITSYGPSFELAHDATLARLDRNILDTDYIGSMQDIVSKQVFRKAESGQGEDKQAATRLVNQIKKGASNFEKGFRLLAYCAHGNPRHLLKTVGMLAGDFGPTKVENLVKDYYRSEIWKEHTGLGEKFMSFAPIVDWGRDFVEKSVIPSLMERNRAPETRGTIETTAFFWISKDSPQEVKKALSLLSYVGLVQELDRGIRGTRSKSGTRYLVHFGTLITRAAHPQAELERIVPHLARKRMVEYGENHAEFKKLQFDGLISDDMLTFEAIEKQFDASVDVLDLTDWQRSTLKNNSFHSVGDVLAAGEEALKEKIYMVGVVRARQISNAAKSAVLEYLLG